MVTSERFALYFAPEAGSALERFGATWLGREPVTGSPLPQPVLPGLDPDELHRLTITPRHYGLHGTLVPPLGLRADCTRTDFKALVDHFAAGREPFAMEPLVVREIGSFIALVPEGQRALSALAGAALRVLHPCRRPPSAAELAGRRSHGLSARQEEMLERWGYPYVLDEFRFHMTLTDRVQDSEARARLARLIKDHAAPVTGRPWAVNEVCVFHQPSRQEPFHLIHRARLGNKD